MDVLVFGIGGLVGGNVACSALKRNYEVGGTYHSTDPQIREMAATRQVDLKDLEEVTEVIESYSPDCIVNAAAVTDVDRCESEPDLAQEVNAVAPKLMADACASIGSRFVHFSTDYVFDGNHDSRYQEDAETNPLQVYGRTKLAGEENVLSAHQSSLVLRISFVYGYHQGEGALDGFPRWVLDQFGTEGEIPLFEDQMISPTRAGHVAEAALDLSDAGAIGIFHATSRSCVTPYEFGERIRRMVGAADSKIERASRSDVGLAAERPQHTCLDVGRIESALGRKQPTLGDDLNAIESFITGHYT